MAGYDRRMGERVAPTTGSSAEPSAVRRRPGFWALASVVARLSIPVMLVLWAITPPPLPDEVWYQARDESGALVPTPRDERGDPMERVELWALTRSGVVEPLSIELVAEWEVDLDWPPELEEQYPTSTSTSTPSPEYPFQILIVRRAALERWVVGRWPGCQRALRRTGWFTVGGPARTTMSGLGPIQPAPIVREMGRARFVRYVCVEADPPSSLLDALLDLF